MASPGPPERYRFGPFELQPDQRRLLKDGATISLRPRAFDLLVALVDRAGHLVTKDELLDQVWPKMVVEEAALHVQCPRCARSSAAMPSAPLCSRWRAPCGASGRQGLIAIEPPRSRSALCRRRVNKWSKRTVRWRTLLAEPRRS